MTKTVAERSLAVFIDFENLAMGFKDRNDRFDVKRVLKRLLEKGKIVAKKAYCDWSRFGSYTASLHEAAIELVEIPKRSQTGKNSADIRLCVDAMDLAYSKEHIDTFVVVSGDSDFSPLVSKLKELGKHVIGLGMADSTSNLLRDNCDEFIYYEDLATQDAALDKLIQPNLPEMKRKGFSLLLNALVALRRENKETLWSSMVKDTMKRIRPSFNETYHGYRSFSEMLEDAQRHGLITLETDAKSGTYVVSGFAAAGSGSAGASRPRRPAPRPVEKAQLAPAVVAEEAAGPEDVSAAAQPSQAGEPAGADEVPKKKRRSRGRRGGRGRVKIKGPDSGPPGGDSPDDGGEE